MMRLAFALTATALLSACGTPDDSSSAKEFGRVSPKEPPMTCMAYWSGFAYDFASDSCVQRGTSGCSNPFKFTTQKQCDGAAHTVVLEGVLGRVMAIGGETTGLALQVFGGDSVEIDSIAEIHLESLIGHHVTVVGKVERRRGIEIPVRRVIVADSIKPMAKRSVNEANAAL